MADSGKLVDTQVGGNQADNSDLAALANIRNILNEFYPEVRKAMLEYCLFVTEKDLEG